MPTPGPVAYAVWAVPSPRDRQRLSAVIRDLAQRIGGPTFEPHVTICSGVVATGAAALPDRLRALAADVKPFRGGVGEVEGTDDYFSALFVRVSVPDPVLARAVEAFPDSHPPKIGAHLSVLYAEAGPFAERRRAIATTVPALPARLRFDSLVLVSPTTGVWRDVTRWRQIATASLGKTERTRAG